MTVTVSVDATWRLSRVEFNTQHNMPWDVRGMGEVLLQEATESAPILGKGTRDGEKVTYGAMPSTPVSRLIDDVMEETVDVGGTAVSFKTIMDALPLFFEKWRTEDADTPMPTMSAPQAAKETEMPPLRTPPKTDTPPPPPAETFKG
jgi:hypothetical protein